jgi:hypothetical protein
MNAQFEINNKFYVSSELNIGNHLGFDLNFNVITKKNYSFKVGYTGNLKTSSKPDDFTSSNDRLLIFRPFDYFNSFQVGLGKIYDLHKNGNVRLNLSFGLAFTTVKRSENWQFNAEPFSSEGFYSWDTKKNETVSFIINPKIEIPLRSVFGITISPMVQLNKQRTYVGVGIGAMIGLLRDRINLKKIHGN